MRALLAALSLWLAAALCDMPSREILLEKARVLAPDGK